MRMKTHPQYFISKSRGGSKVGITIGIDLGDIWSHCCTLNEDGEVVNRGRFRTNPSGVDKRFRDMERARVAMETGTHSIWVSEQIQELIMLPPSISARFPMRLPIRGRILAGRKFHSETRETTHENSSAVLHLKITRRFQGDTSTVPSAVPTKIRKGLACSGTAPTAAMHHS